MCYRIIRCIVFCGVSPGHMVRTRARVRASAGEVQWRIVLLDKVTNDSPVALTRHPSRLARVENQFLVFYSPGGSVGAFNGPWWHVVTFRSALLW